METWEPNFPPKISMARFAMTSFVFMLLWVPEPVCQITENRHQYYDLGFFYPTIILILLLYPL
jgi:uncharacterized membrane protein